MPTRVLAHVRTLAVSLTFLTAPTLVGSAAAQSVGADQLAGAGCSADPNDPQMLLTSPLLPAPGDAGYVRALGERVRAAIAPYHDVKRAERDGYRGFGDDPGAGIVHYVNGWRSFREGARLNPEKPGALLYLRDDTGPEPTYELVGAMFTAKDTASVDELNARVPLSQATWHLHTNICTPRPIWSAKKWARKTADGRPLYGAGSPTDTRAECDAARGKFHDRIFGWMVHVYPFRKDPATWWQEDARH